MTSKYALIIGNSIYTDPTLPALATPARDAESLADVLANPEIGEFEVTKLLNATAQEMRLAISDLFSSKHKPDDTLLLYFSGHGELDDNDNLYLVARDTQRGTRLAATGVEAAFIASCMSRARSNRQVVILDSCYSGAFAKGSKGQRIGTKSIFEGNGYGRYVLTASDALQLSWEGDRIIEDLVVNSFFTHYLVEGLQSGAADQNGDGYIDIDELYDYIHEGMGKASSKQQPLKYTFSEKGGLLLARSPISKAARDRARLTDLIGQAESIAAHGDLTRAEEMLSQVILANDPFLTGVAQTLLQEITAERERIAAYSDVKRLIERHPRSARAAWAAFIAKYPGFDPDNVTQMLPQPRKSLISSQKLMPNPFEWIEIPHKGVGQNGYSISKYPVTNGQYQLFIEANGYKEDQWWSTQGLLCRQHGIALGPKSQYDKSYDWVRSAAPWTEPLFWTEPSWKGHKFPVVGVSWYEAVAFCNWLSAVTGETIKLPTEYQWQYASQGDDNREYSWGDVWKTNACNCRVPPPKFPFSFFIASKPPERQGRGTTPVDSYAASSSPFGVMDLVGNVEEWCLTELTTKVSSLDTHPSQKVVTHGGSWRSDNENQLKNSVRNSYRPVERHAHIGFRCVRLFE